MSGDIKSLSFSVDRSKNRWRYRVAFTTNVYLDIETDSADTPDEELERLVIEAFRLGSKEGPDLPLDDAGIGGLVISEDVRVSRLA